MGNRDTMLSARLCRSAKVVGYMRLKVQICRTGHHLSSGSSSHRMSDRDWSAMNKCAAHPLRHDIQRYQHYLKGNILVLSILSLVQGGVRAYFYIQTTFFHLMRQNSLTHRWTAYVSWMQCENIYIWLIMYSTRQDDGLPRQTTSIEAEGMSRHFEVSRDFSSAMPSPPIQVFLTTIASQASLRQRQGGWSNCIMSFLVLSVPCRRVHPTNIAGSQGYLYFIWPCLRWDCKETLEKEGSSRFVALFRQRKKLHISLQGSKSCLVFLLAVGFRV